MNIGPISPAFSGNYNIFIKDNEARESVKNEIERMFGAEGVSTLNGITTNGENDPSVLNIWTPHKQFSDVDIDILQHGIQSGLEGWTSAIKDLFKQLAGLKESYEQYPACLQAGIPPVTEADLALRAKVAATAKPPIEHFNSLHAII